MRLLDTWLLGNNHRTVWSPHCANLMHSDLGDCGDPSRLNVRVYLKFLLADGTTAEFVRTYKPDIMYVVHGSGQ